MMDRKNGVVVSSMRIDTAARITRGPPGVMAGTVAATLRVIEVPEAQVCFRPELVFV